MLRQSRFAVAGWIVDGLQWLIVAQLVSSSLKSFGLLAFHITIEDLMAGRMNICSSVL